MNAHPLQNLPQTCENLESSGFQRLSNELYFVGRRIDVFNSYAVKMSRSQSSWHPRNQSHGRTRRKPEGPCISISLWKSLNTYQMTWILLVGLVDVLFKSERVLKRRSKDDEVEGRHGEALESDYFDAECIDSHSCLSLSNWARSANGERLVDEPETASVAGPVEAVWKRHHSGLWITHHVHMAG